LKGNGRGLAPLSGKGHLLLPGPGPSLMPRMLLTVEIRIEADLILKTGNVPPELQHVPKQKPEQNQSMVQLQLTLIQKRKPKLSQSQGGGVGGSITSLKSARTMEPSVGWMMTAVRRLVRSGAHVTD
jgi:hypothetical protein